VTIGALPRAAERAEPSLLPLLARFLG
jgi:hypothetical protein